MRMLTKEVSIGNVKIGGKNPIAIQSMTNTKTEDVTATVAQILELEKAGCDIIRCAVPTMEAAKALKDIGISREWGRQDPDQSRQHWKSGTDPGCSRLLPRKKYSDPGWS